MSDRINVCRREEGFTILELAAVVVILTIILIVVTVNYASTRNIMALKSAADEVESAIGRCFAIASQEGVDVYLEFFDESGDNAKHYAIFWVYAPEGLDERTNDEPTETPAPGSGYTTDGSGHYWFQLAEGKCWSTTDAVFLFQRRGTVVVVTACDAAGNPTDDPLEVTARTESGDTRAVYFNETGEILD